MLPLSGNTGPPPTPDAPEVGAELALPGEQRPSIRLGKNERLDHVRHRSANNAEDDPLWPLKRTVSTVVVVPHFTPV